MDGDKFKSLEIEEQVEYINGLIEQGYTVEDIRLTLGIGKNYIGNTFKKAGYVKDRTSRLYILLDLDSDDLEVSQSHHIRHKQLHKEPTNIKALESRVENLEKELEQLKAIILSNTKNTCNTNVAVNTANNIKQYSKDNLVSRNYKIDRQVVDQFVEFCKMQKLINNYKVSDLITNALVEYMGKFNQYENELKED